MNSLQKQIRGASDQTYIYDLVQAWIDNWDSFTPL